VSIKRMNIEEKARYLIGEAIMRRVEKWDRGPDIDEAIQAVMRWIEAWLQPEELNIVRIGTGLPLDEVFEKELAACLAEFPDHQAEDEIPF
jgi:hypothetical protein